MPFPLDISASSSTNYVVGEVINITITSIVNSGIVFLKNAPFFGKDISITVVTVGGVTKTLVLGTDFWLVGQLRGIGASSGGVYGGVFVADPTLAGKWTINYRSLGGVESIDNSQGTKYFAVASNRLQAANTELIVSGTLSAVINTTAGMTALQNQYVVLPLAFSYYNLGLPAINPGTNTNTGTGTGAGGGTTGGGTTTGATASPATTTTIGTIQLAGDLGGTATAPTVPGLAGKQATLIASQNIKTIGGQNPLGTGDIAFKTINGQSIVGSGDIAITVTTNTGTTVTPSSIGAATSIQGAKADSAVQSVNNKNGTSIVITAQDVGAATAAQGSAADTAIQSINGKTGNSLTLIPSDIGALSKTTADSYYAQLSQGLLAQSAYQKPAGGIGLTDLAMAVQNQINASATAVQSVNGISGNNVNLIPSDIGALSQVLADARYVKLTQISQLQTSITPATASVVGGVKAGTGVTIAADGTLSVNGATSIANGNFDTATLTALGNWFVSFIQALPKTAPTTSGKLWVNNGVISTT